MHLNVIRNTSEQCWSLFQSFWHVLSEDFRFDSIKWISLFRMLFKKIPYRQTQDMLFKEYNVLLTELLMCIFCAVIWNAQRKFIEHSTQQLYSISSVDSWPFRFNLKSFSQFICYFWLYITMTQFSWF